MSRIRGKDTKPEITVRKFLYAQGLRYRLYAELPGRPDIIIRKRKTVIFVNGCFWHAHKDCPDFRWPKTRSEFWEAKIKSNVERDVRNYSELNRAGWHVLTVWECEIKKHRDEALRQLYTNIVNNEPSKGS